MARVKTFAPGGSGTADDFNAIQDDYELAFSAYRTILRRAGSGHAILPGVNILPATPDAAVFLVSGTPNDATAAFWFDPAMYAAGTRAVKVRIQAAVLGGASGTITFGLYPVATWSVPSNGPSIAALGAVIAGSTIAVTPGVNPPSHATTADFTAPAAGWYVLAASVVGTTGADSPALTAELQMHQV